MPLLRLARCCMRCGRRCCTACVARRPHHQCLHWCCPRRAASPALLPVQFAYPFNSPVDVAKYRDYAVYVRQPMDFGSMRAKAEEGGYGEPAEVYRDALLVFNNARRYNQPTEDVSYMATVLQVGAGAARDACRGSVAPGGGGRIAATGLPRGLLRNHGAVYGRVLLLVLPHPSPVCFCMRCGHGHRT
eukprot:GHRQ01027903.1.p1 GENE.GHRQ01027903.1~~GHRQ01027903.1.p1  ORF type:complete len:188 (+),score=55.16 GHRQ01027903.1:85-648(+)